MPRRDILRDANGSRLQRGCVMRGSGLYGMVIGAAGCNRCTSDRRFNRSVWLSPECASRCGTAETVDSAPVNLCVSCAAVRLRDIVTRTMKMALRGNI